MAAIDSAQLDELTNALENHGVKYLYIGKSAAIVHGFADTTQDADIFLDHDLENKAKAIRALEQIGFKLTQEQKDEIKAGRDFVQFHSNGPFDVDLIFAPDGIEKFADAWERGRKIDGHRVCGIEDVIASKKAANRPKDRESLKRLEAFKEYLDNRPRRGERLEPLNRTWRDRIKMELAAQNKDQLGTTGANRDDSWPERPSARNHLKRSTSGKRETDPDKTGYDR